MQETETGKFFNCVDFPVNFRMIWLPGSPAIKIQPGQVIEGPYGLLASYNFLRPLGMQWNSVPEVKVIREPTPVVYREDVERDIKDQETLAISVGDSFRQEEIKVVENTETLELPFDINAPNWVKLTAEQLEESAKKLNVWDDVIEKMSAGKRKWELIRRIKKALGK